MSEIAISSQAARDPRASLALWLGAALTGLFVFAVLLSLVWTPYPVDAMDMAARLRPPSAAHWFGTDHFGRDVLSMILVGARNSLAVAVVAAGVGLLVGAPLGLLAAAKGGLTDELVMRSNDLIFAFPSLLLAIMITAVAGPGAINALIAIGIFNIPVFARVARGAALSLWTRDYVLAARVAGKRPGLISLQHILPNIANLLIVQGAIQFSMGVLAEAALSYVGLGAQPPTPSWGRMLNEAQTMIAFAPWLAIFPGVVIVLSVLGLNLLGDGLRDLFDPKLDRSR
jgi:peptide/nickel transport system permease protein